MSLREQISAQCRRHVCLGVYLLCLRKTSVDEEQQALSLPLYGDENEIPLWEWHAIRGGYGATFIFYAEGARKCEDVEDYPGTVRRTSPVTAIARVAEA
jgi:hypothetical protein